MTGNSMNPRVVDTDATIIEYLIYFNLMAGLTNTIANLAAEVISYKIGFHALIA